MKQRMIKLLHRALKLAMKDKDYAEIALAILELEKQILKTRETEIHKGGHYG